MPVYKQKNKLESYRKKSKVQLRRKKSKVKSKRRKSKVKSKRRKSKVKSKRRKSKVKSKRRKSSNFNKKSQVATLSDALEESPPPSPPPSLPPTLADLSEPLAGYYRERGVPLEEYERLVAVFEEFFRGGNMAQQITSITEGCTVSKTPAELLLLIDKIALNSPNITSIDLSGSFFRDVEWEDHLSELIKKLSVSVVPDSAGLRVTGFPQLKLVYSYEFLTANLHGVTPPLILRPDISNIYQKYTDWEEFFAEHTSQPYFFFGNFNDFTIIKGLLALKLDAQYGLDGYINVLLQESVGDFDFDDYALLPVSATTFYNISGGLEVQPGESIAYELFDEELPFPELLPILRLFIEKGARPNFEELLLGDDDIYHHKDLVELDEDDEEVEILVPDIRGIDLKMAILDALYLIIRNFTTKEITPYLPSACVWNQIQPNYYILDEPGLLYEQWKWPYYKSHSIFLKNLKL